MATVAPSLNTFDLPELMLGARPSANPAQREEFMLRCKELHRNQVTATSDQAQRNKSTRPHDAAAAAEIQAMFPVIDLSLIWSILADTSSREQAIDILLALSIATLPGDSENVAGSSCPKEICFEDQEKFPSLTASQQQQQQHIDLGTAWSDCVKAAAICPSVAATITLPFARHERRSTRKPKTSESCEEQVETEYEMRQRAGRRRAKYHGSRIGNQSRRLQAHAEPGDADANNSNSVQESVDDP